MTIITDPQQLGSLVRERRKSLGLTQTELATLCNLSLNGISNIEKGATDIRLSTLQKISTFLGFKIALEWEK